MEETIEPPRGSETRPERGEADDDEKAGAAIHPEERDGGEADRKNSGKETSFR
jgi:hypothetical protein